MLCYSKDVIKALYNADKTRTVTLLVLDLKQGNHNISKVKKGLIIADIQKLKLSNKWSYETEEQLLKEYQNKLKKKKAIEGLSPKDRDLYNLKRLEKLRDYNFTL